MRVVIIGGSGHVGTYLVPRLIEAGHEVVNVSRGQRDAYQPHAAWAHVEQVALDREAEEAAGTFGAKIRDLQPDAVIDMICFTLASAQHLVDALRGQVQHFLHCGTIWTFGPSIVVPMPESAPKHPFGEYGIQKAAIEKYLLQEAHLNGFPATLLHPGHIVGPGWVPLNPQGNFNPGVYETLAHGDPLPLAHIGMETVHHVHADDVAQIFQLALENRSVALGESFHTVSPAAVTLRGYAEAVAAWFGQEAHLAFMPWEAFKDSIEAEDAAQTWEHIAHSPNASIEKGRRLLGYNPRYSSLQAIKESVDWLVAEGIVKV
jgi:nucleoside-diphosphate-sugar epimerase